MSSVFHNRGAIADPFKRASSLIRLAMGSLKWLGRCVVVGSICPEEA